jgi:hypothetical protein
MYKKFLPEDHPSIHNAQKNLDFALQETQPNSKKE